MPMKITKQYSYAALYTSGFSEVTFISRSMGVSSSVDASVSTADISTDRYT